MGLADTEEGESLGEELPSLPPQPVAEAAPAVQTVASDFGRIEMQGTRVLAQIRETLGLLQDIRHFVKTESDRLQRLSPPGRMLPSPHLSHADVAREYWAELQATAGVYRKVISDLGAAEREVRTMERDRRQGGAP